MLVFDSSEVAKRVSRWSLPVTGNAMVFSRSRFSALRTDVLRCGPRIRNRGKCPLGNVVIAYDTTDTITLTAANLHHLSANDFHIV